MLEKLDRNVCYCDTDSTVYIENEQTKKIVDQYIGEGLGEQTDELGGNYMKFWCWIMDIFSTMENKQEKLRDLK